MKKFFKGTVFGFILGGLLVSAGTGFAISNSIKLIVDGNEIFSDVPPQIIQGRTMVPARALVEALGAKVGWDNDSRAVIITSKDVLNSNVTPTDIPAYSDSGLTDNTAKKETPSINSFDMTGTWNVGIALSSGQSVAIIYKIVQDGDKISGTYGGGNGTFEGKISGTSIKGTWNDYGKYGGGTADNVGSFEWTIMEDGQTFTGEWNSFGDKKGKGKGMRGAN